MNTLLLPNPAAAWTTVLGILSISTALAADAPKPPQQTHTKPATPSSSVDAAKILTKEDLDASIKERQARIRVLEKKIEEFEKKRDIWARESAAKGKSNPDKVDFNKMRESAAEGRRKAERHDADKVEKHTQEADARADAVLKGAPATPVTTDKAAPKKD